METRLNIPQNWQDFESICHKLWREIWSDPDTQKNGRGGQAQHGVDIFGMPYYLNQYCGVQCKDKNSNLGSILKKGELISECTNALEFKPKLNSFTMATTCPKDEDIQSLARELTNDNRFPFSVQVWSWNDIESEIIYRPNIINHYYPTSRNAIENQNKIKLNHFSSKENLHAFFSRSIFQNEDWSSFKDLLLSLIFELSDNAYNHGDASFFEISFDKNKFILKDNGKKFNPLKELDPKSVSPEKYVGSFVFDLFRKTFKGFNISYKNTSKRGEKLNVIDISLPHDIETYNKLDFFEINLEVNQAISRTSAIRLARSIILPNNIKELIINIPYVYALSAFMGFTMEMLNLLKEDQRLIIYVPRYAGSLKESMSWIKGNRLTIIPR